ncbi:uncharacterized protein LOC133832837 [Humulus lupulus]|uniref:uncharacterized protein LOC133832837 n=1 Tax=Humulus lupulus TaxID=3486 RepID=UPI002B405867|nr:uncharacterized protein LOC133832837 [Humulus lupulus]
MPQQPMNQAPPDRPNELQAALLTLTNTQTQFMTETRSSIRNLETQVGQLANMLNNRPQGNLPSNTEVNPKEQVQAITLRSDKQIEQPSVQQSTIQNKELGEKSDTIGKGVIEDHQSSEKSPPVVVDQPVRVPYPQRLRKTTLGKQFSKLFEVFKKLHINIPFAEALEHMPSYVKFMKEILSKKRKMEDYETVALTEECSAILQRKLPQKLRDPESFTIPCTIGQFECKRVLCDLGASINLMLLLVFRRLGLGEARPTTVTLQLADRSVKHPRGIIEDVLKTVSKRKVSSDALEVVSTCGEVDDDDVEMREYVDWINSYQPYRKKFEELAKGPERP